MEGYVVSARKYRPKGFEEVVGQEHITTTLKNSIDNDHLAQALLFCGPRGVGKTTCARIVAKMINDLDDSVDPSHNIFELDAASNNSVDHIRNLTDQVRYPPQYGKYKVYIIDEVHMLSNAAFNAFLKTLEEPPPYAIFILATTEKHKVIPTILSRCQIYDFNRIEVNDIKKHLQKIADHEGIKTEEDALYLISQKSDGALRDALSIFDLIVNFSTDNSITYQSTIDNLHILDYDYYFKITEHLLNQDHSSALLIFDTILKKGFDGHNFIVGLSEHFRNLMVCKDKETVALLEVADSIKEKYYNQAQHADTSFLLSALSIANQCDMNYKVSKNQRLVVELALMKISHLPSLFDITNVQQEGNPENKKKTDLGSEKVISEPPAQVEKIKSEEKISEPEPEKKIEPEAEIKIESTPEATPETPPTPEPESEPEPQPKSEPRTFTSKKLKSTTRIPKLDELKTTPKEIIKEVQEEVVTNDTDLPAESSPLDESLVKKALAEIREDLESDQEKNLLTSKVSVENSNIVVLELSNPVMLDLLERFKTTLVGKLKEKLSASYLKIEGRLVESNSDGERKLYTNREKFDYLTKKEPLLGDLSKRLGLDPDF